MLVQGVVERHSSIHLTPYTSASAKGRFSVYKILIQAARPSIQAWVANTAAKYKNKEANESSIKATENFNALGNFTHTDIDALCFGNGTSGKK
jgi:hypothetical protein